MITPRITCCKECIDIVPLIEEINCRLSKLSSSAYNNIIYALNTPVNQTEATSLLFYKRILQYKIVNPDYAAAFTVEMIASQIKKYTVGCDRDCTCEEFMKSLGFITSTSTSTTTSTTTLPSTTTTTTTLTPTTTTTSTTVPPTTTTTTTAIGLFSFFISLGAPTRDLIACNFPIPTPITGGKVYSSTSPFGVNTVFYADPALTIPFDANGLYYKINGSPLLWLIGNTGIVSASVTCPPSFFFSGGGDSGSACNTNAFPFLFYPSSATLAAGVIVYEDPDHTNLFNGNDNFFKPSTQNTVYNIDTLGEITSVVPCPTTSSTTTIEPPVVEYALTFGDIDPLVACGQSLYPNVVFSLNPIFGLGTALGFDGNNLWYQALGHGTGPAGSVWRINAGIVLEQRMCPIPLTTTTTTTS